MLPNANAKKPSGTFKSGAILYMCVLAAFVVLYGLTAQRSVAWQDSGIFQWRILNFDLAGRMGLALAHPLLIVLGKAFSWFPAGEVTWRINMVSGVAGAFATANVVLLVRRLTGKSRKAVAAALIAGGFFALAHTTWWLATICESQMVYAAIFTLELHLLVNLVRRNQLRWAALLGFANGLALTAHNLAFLALPAYVVLAVWISARRRLPPTAVIFMLCGWVIGAGGYIGLIAHRAMDTGLSQAVHSALFGASWQGNVTGFSQRAVVMGAGYILFNLPNLALPLAVMGAWKFKERLSGRLGWTLIYLTLVYLLFAVRYAVPDQFMFFVPFYVMVAVLAGLGIETMVSRGQWVVLYLAGMSVVVAPALYASAPALCRSLDMPLPGRKDLPFRDPHRYWLVPWKSGEDSAGRFARAALRQAPTGGIIVADGTSYYPLKLTRRLEDSRRRARLLLSSRASPRNVPPGTPNVFIVSDLPSYHPAWMDEHADYLKPNKDAALFRVVWRNDQAAKPHDTDEN